MPQPTSLQLVTKKNINVFMRTCAHIHGVCMHGCLIYLCMYVYMYTFIHVIICILTEGILDISHIRPTMSSTQDINIASLVYLSSQTAAAHVHHTAKSMCKALSRALRAPLYSYGCRIHRGNTATGVAYTEATQLHIDLPQKASAGLCLGRLARLFVQSPRECSMQ